MKRAVVIFGFVILSLFFSNTANAQCANSSDKDKNEYRLIVKVVEVKEMPNAGSGYFKGNITAVLLNGDDKLSLAKNQKISFCIDDKKLFGQFQVDKSAFVIVRKQVGILVRYQLIRRFDDLIVTERAKKGGQ